MPNQTAPQPTSTTPVALLTDALRASVADALRIPQENIIAFDPGVEIEIGTETRGPGYLSYEAPIVEAVGRAEVRAADGTVNTVFFNVNIGNNAVGDVLTALLRPAQDRA